MDRQYFPSHTRRGSPPRAHLVASVMYSVEPRRPLPDDRDISYETNPTRKGAAVVGQAVSPANLRGPNKNYETNPSRPILRSTESPNPLLRTSLTVPPRQAS